mmetsp:Transcript_35758/g.89010  ORF Transcript_35758/g.89010 Transcript_35758/m.89010 type:complete len:291 (-) Transcript_35758:101-973(-)
MCTLTPRMWEGTCLEAIRSSLWKRKVTPGCGTHSTTLGRADGPTLAKRFDARTLTPRSPPPPSPKPAPPIPIPLPSMPISIPIPMAMGIPMPSPPPSPSSHCRFFCPAMPDTSMGVPTTRGRCCSLCENWGTGAMLMLGLMLREGGHMPMGSGPPSGGGTPLLAHSTSIRSTFLWCSISRRVAAFIRAVWASWSVMSGFFRRIPGARMAGPRVPGCPMYFLRKPICATSGFPVPCRWGGRWALRAPILPGGGLCRCQNIQALGPSSSSIAPIIGSIGSVTSEACGTSNES